MMSTGSGCAVVATRVRMTCLIRGIAFEGPGLVRRPRGADKSRHSGTNARRVDLITSPLGDQTLYLDVRNSGRSLVLALRNAWG